MSTLSRVCGHFFIISFSQPFPDDEILYFIQDNEIGGLILFANHCHQPDDLKSWLAELKETLDYPFLVAVDQEGGRVRRFDKRFPMLEAPRYYGRHLRYDAYRDDLLGVCEHLREIGVNINLVPTVDLLDSQPGHVLDTRTFSDDIEVVSRFSRITIDVHHHQGILTCGKHFPGLGRSRGDPHLSLAACDLTEKDFYEVELGSFQDIIEYGVDSIMVTHLAIPRVDEKPSIVSEKIVSGWLKERLGFAGSVISDDLLMSGAGQAAGFPQIAPESFKAGCDVLLFGQDFTLMCKAFEYFAEQVEAGDITDQRLEEARKRVDDLRNKVVT